MKQDETPPLSGFAADLLRAEKRRPPPSAGQRRSLWRRAHGTLVAAGLLTPAVWSAAPTAAAVVLSKVGIIAIWSAVAAGIVTGAVTTAGWIERPAERGTAVTPVAAPAQDRRPLAVALPAPAPVAAGAPPEAERPGERRPGRRPEQALIDQARAALARNDLDTAQRALDEHDRHFARGLFRQEREALGVLVLVRAGQIPQARAAAVSFERRFPDSVFLPLLANALGRAR
jgi:hypothetical protein